MGWLYSTEWDSAASMRKHLREQLNRPDGSRVVLKDAATKYGRNYWAAIKDTATGEVFIFHALINGSKSGGFGYKDMDEFMGPCEVDCPLSVLNLATPITGDLTRHNGENGDRWATDWRANVRAYHAKRAEVAALAKSVKVGDDVWFRDIVGKETPFRVTTVGPKYRGFKNGVLYRLPMAKLVKVETPTAA